MKKIAILACIAVLALCVTAFAGCNGDTTSSDPASSEAAVSSTPESSAPESSAPESSAPEASEPEASEPEASEPEASEPEASEPEASEPEASEPETSAPSGTPSGKGEQVAALAKTLLDKPFELGAAGPDAFDNSGLIFYCFKEQGVALPRRTSEMFNYGTEVTLEELQPGDVVFFYMENEGKAEYAGIYVGDDQFVAANNPDSPTSLQTITWAYYQTRFVGARRY